MKNVALVFAAVLFVCSGVFGASLSAVTEGQLPSDVTWVVHLDMEQFNSSIAGKLIGQELKDQGAEEKLEAFAQIFSFHPLKDIANITIIGQGADPSKAVAMAQGNLNQDALTALIKMGQSYESSQEGNYTIHSWEDEKKDDGTRLYGTFHDERTVLMGLNGEILTYALDAIDGKSYDLEYKYDLMDFLWEHDGVFLTAAAQNVDDITSKVDDAGPLKQLSSFALAIGEEDANLYIDIIAQTKTSEAATNIAQMLQGFVAMATLSTQQDMPKLAKMAQAIEIHADSDTIRIQFDWDSEDFLTTAKEMGEKHNVDIDAAIGDAGNL